MLPRNACPIPENGHLIVTGGFNTKYLKAMSRVTLYNRYIPNFQPTHVTTVSNLPNLITGRFDHGCSSFMMKEDSYIRKVEEM